MTTSTCSLSLCTRDLKNAYEGLFLVDDIVLEEASKKLYTLYQNRYPSIEYVYKVLIEEIIQPYRYLYRLDIDEKGQDIWRRTLEDRDFVARPCVKEDWL